MVSKAACAAFLRRPTTPDPWRRDSVSASKAASAAATAASRAAALGAIRSACIASLSFSTSRIIKAHRVFVGSRLQRLLRHMYTPGDSAFCAAENLGRLGVRQLLTEDQQHRLAQA